MTRTANTAAPSSSNDARPATLQRRGRLGSAIASILVSTLLIGSVVFGMTDMADDAPQFAAAATPAARA